MVGSATNVVLRKVDIVSWKSAAFAQAEKEWGIKGIPYLRVYAKDGSFVQEIKTPDINAVRAAVAKASN